MTPPKCNNCRWPLEPVPAGQAVVPLLRCEHCGREVPAGAVAVNERVCACGCGASLDGLRSDAEYASNACKVRAYKRRTGYVLQAKRQRRQTPQATRPRKPDMRIALTKAVEIGADLAARPPARDPRQTAELAMRDALTNHQRVALSDAASETERARA